MIRGLNLVSITNIMRRAKNILGDLMDLKIKIDNESKSID